MSDFVETELRSTGAGLFAGGGHVAHEALVELGWDDLLTAEPRAAITALAEAQGAHLGTSRLVELVIAAEVALDPGTVSLAFPLGALLTTDAADAVVLAGARPTVVVPVETYGVVQFHEVVGSVEATPGIDPSAGLGRVRGTLGPNVGWVEAATWERAAGLGSLALAHETIGLVQALLDLAVAHVRDRHQFGVPIGTFQAVQHRLADVHTRAEAARAICRTAWAGGRPAHATAALVAARTAATAATEHCHQVLGAMGCTWEHPAHRYIRRAAVLALLLQPGAALAAVASADLLGSGQIEVFG